MRFARTVFAFAMAIGFAGPGCDSGEGPTNIEIPITELHLTTSCAGMVSGNTCTLVAQARTNGGLIVPNPVLDWFSSNPTIASVSGSSSSGLVSAHTEGSATITVSNTSGTVSDETRVSVLFCSKC